MITLIFAPICSVVTFIAYFKKVSAPRCLWLIISGLAALDFFVKLLGIV